MDSVDLKLQVGAGDPICKDCKHHGSFFFVAMCYSPRLGVDPVDGVRITSTCRKQRSHFERYSLGHKVCGPRGEWFMPLKAPR